MAGRKGVTIIIAIILAVALTLALAAGSFFFITKTQRAAQGVAESGASNLASKFGACTKIQDVKPLADNTTQIIMRNCGFKKINLANDNVNVILKTEGGQSCTFTLNDQNCFNCKGELEIGAFIALRLDNNNINCGTRLVTVGVSQQEQIITLSDIIDANLGQSATIVTSTTAESAIASLSFPIVKEIVCTFELGSPPDQIKDRPETTFCFNQTIKNTGNVPDTFTIDSGVTGAATSFLGFFNGSGCVGQRLTPDCTLGSFCETNTCPGDPSFVTFDVTLDKNETFEFSYLYNVTCGPGDPVDVFELNIISATSGNCGAETRDKTCHCVRKDGTSCFTDPRCFNGVPTVLPPPPV